MTICLELTAKELATLLSLASDQLFRKEFIDARMPGFRTNAEELQFAKDLVKRLREFLQQQGPPSGALKRKPGNPAWGQIGKPR